MSNTWQDLSEVISGLILQGKIPLNSIDFNLLTAPYDGIGKLIKEMEDEIDTNKIVEAIGLGPVQTAIQAADSVSSMDKTKTDWLSLLKTAYVNQEVGTFLIKTGNKMVQGKPIDVTKLTDATNKLIDGKGSRLVKMSEVKGSKMPFVKTGWEAWDRHFGGVPKVGLVTIAAPPKTGKTTTMMKLLTCFSARYPDKSSALFTLEMMSDEFKGRLLESNPDMTEEQMDRIWMTDEIMSVTEVAAKSSGIPDLGLVIVDFADLLIEGDVDTNKMEGVYRTLAILAKRQKIPVILVAQLSGSYQGGVPRPVHLRWTRLAEALTWMLVFLYSPAKDYFAEKDKTLTPVPGYSYIICWLSRGGFRKHNGPGAIMLPWKGRGGWGEGAGRWFSLGQETVEDTEDD